jgi:hypothetical protein
MRRLAAHRNPSALYLAHLTARDEQHRSVPS